MFVGHSLLAFAAVAAVASRAFADVDGRRALVLGAIAGAFASVPDADMAYAATGLADVALAASAGAGVGGDGVFAVTGAFWAASTVVHRSMTHSLVVAPVAAAGFALLVHRGRRARPAVATGGVVLAALAAVAALVHGALGLFVFAAFVAAGAAVAVLVRSQTDVGARGTFALALVGLASHPFGDVFTGEPPALLWPLDARLLDARVALSPDPTLHLLAAFALELAVVALALLVYADLTDRRLGPSPRALGGVAYGLAAFVLPAPTLDVSYHFVFSILAVGVVAASPGFGATVHRLVARARTALDGVAPRPVSADGGRPVPAPLDGDRVLSSLATAVTTISLALAAYAVGYLVVG
ncbi:metal-dependent hydrolase [Halorubellus sp. PRR65]|uniref:metal-dependent hydrolase n=1 Tax=Halorubellus sp. PRR65 TaxID=3098148 RepID=UPI002B25A273|nr:metal-dependent hydrolase [Halorubellus sp. PRR65]